MRKRNALVRSRFGFVLPSVIVALFVPSFAMAQIVGPPPRRPQIDPNGVDVQTGNLHHQMTDLQIGGEGIGALEYTREYSSGTLRDNFSGMLETHWNFMDGTSSMTASFGSQGGDVLDGDEIDGSTYVWRNGTVVTYNHLLVSQCDGMSGQCDTYTNAGQVDFPDGVRWMLNRRDEWAGGRTYSRIQSVTSNTGYQIKFEYGTNTLLSDASNSGDWETVTRTIAINNAVEYCAPFADSCALTNAWPQTTYARSMVGGAYTLSVTGPVGNVTTYTSTGTGFAIRFPGSGSNDVAYTTALIWNPCRVNGGLCMRGSPIRVTSANVNGRVTNYSYLHSGDKTTWTVTAAGPLSTTTTYTSSVGLVGITSMTDPLSRTTTYVNTGGYLSRLTEPAGNYTEFGRDDENNPIPLRRYAAPGSPSLPVLEEVRTYATCNSSNRLICLQPTSITDPRGNTTTFTYDPAHGGTLTRTGPADPAGVQPVTRYSYAQRYAWVKNSGGSYVQAATPVWVLTEERTCRTTATVGNACAGGAADEIVTAYDYGPNSGPNNLARRGMTVTAHDGTQIVTRRTCYGYDIYGNRISETAPNAGLTSCP